MRVHEAPIFVQMLFSSFAAMTIFGAFGFFIGLSWGEEHSWSRFLYTLSKWCLVLMVCAICGLLAGHIILWIRFM